MRLPHTGSLLFDYYENFLRDHDIEGFRLNVSARYSQGTLTRILHSGDIGSRRAAVLALGLIGGFETNAAVARGLKDRDPVVRSLAESALWAIWFRADSPENNDALEVVHRLNSRGQATEAIEAADALISRAPKFAEAYNQRAIAQYSLGRYTESAKDCEKVLEINPFHTGALSGLASCQLRLREREKAILTYRRALEVQPYNDGLREALAELEAER